jgi:hypothetical protein
MSSRNRAIVAALILGGVAVALLFVVFAGNACPTDLPGQPCPDAARNVVIGIVLAAMAIGLLVAPFAFLAEFLARRRIVYRDAWVRAARRGILAGTVVAVLAGLRLGGVLSVPVGIFVLILAGVAEWFARRTDIT